MVKIQIKADRLIELINQLCKTEYDASAGTGKYLVVSDNGDVEIKDQPEKRVLTD
ncbi:MAG: hypothetical protein IJL38_01125 [Bacteroidales bacterium]|nr:hypothetical protein [Bacteroidales bacterium]